MPIIRNPFRKQEENLRPATANSQLSNGSATKPVSIGEQEKEPAEYQLSEINDSGVYLPPSPPERKTFWPTTSLRSTTSSNHRSVFNENEQFNISRESFDSYRRSFDISARSPIIQPFESRPRASLDSRTFERPAPRSSLDVRGPPPPRTSNSFGRPSQVPTETREDAFEDVDIAADEPKPQPAKKRGLFARMVDGSNTTNTTESSERPASSDGAGKSSWHHFGGRKRGQSGQGSELGAIKRDGTPGVETAPATSQLKKELVADDNETPAATQIATSDQQEGLAPRVELREPTPEPPTPAMQELNLGAAARSTSSESVVKRELESDMPLFAVSQIQQPQPPKVDVKAQS